MKIESSDEFVWCFSALLCVFLLALAAFAYNLADMAVDTKQCPSPVVEAPVQ